MYGKGGRNREQGAKGQKEGNKEGAIEIKL